MSYSNLAKSYYPANTNNYEKGRAGQKICKITPHHMSGKLSAKSCGSIFQNPTRKASSNYGIGYDGEIACYVEEENRAYTSSSRTNDRQAITIECSNSSNTDPNWSISEATWNSLINLCVDICTRYNFRLEYDGTPNGSLTRHNMFANTDCPGPYLQARFPELANIVNSRLDNQPTLKYKVGDRVNVSSYYASSTDPIEKAVIKNATGTITKVLTNGCHNPYLLDNGAIGWCNDGDIRSYAEEYYPACNRNKSSIVDGLKSIGVDSSFGNRRKIAQKNNIPNYSGTAIENTKMLEKLKAGRLRK